MTSARPQGTTYLTGTCAFRLMSADPPAEGPSTASVTPVGEQGLTLHYTWHHPADGEQHGVLLVGGSDDEGRAEAALFDTWHQQPGLKQLTGTRDGDRIEVAATYLEEWGWEVGVELGADAVSMTMRNVVPESALAMLPPTARR